MSRSDTVWQNQELSNTFLEGVRGAIPLATEHIDILLRILKTAQPQAEKILDLGCGDGILGRAILTQYPNAEGVFLDFSEPMLDAAKAKLGDNNTLEFVIADFATSDWVKQLEEKAPFDIIVSGFAIHHQPDARKKEIYAEIYNLLKPGAIFLNLEHVSSSSKWVEKLSDELFIDSLYNFHQTKTSKQSKEEIANQYYHRPDKAANILAPVETQCEWLKQLGYIHVDCYFKLFEIALFGGIRNTQ